MKPGSSLYHLGCDDDYLLAIESMVCDGLANTDGTTTDESEMWTSDRPTYASFAIRYRDLVANNQAETDFELLCKRQIDGVPTAPAVEDWIARRRGVIAASE